MRKSTISDQDLFIIAKYLVCDSQCDAEMHPDKKNEFENAYANLSGNSPIKANRGGRNTYFVWSQGANKYGMQLRIIFKDAGNVPNELKAYYKGRKPATYRPKKGYLRINSKALVYKLIECGFELKKYQDKNRIKSFMSKRFP